MSYKKRSSLLSKPNDASSGGLYIRQVLEKKITNFSHETLALAFAANRRDHGDRVIKKWLDEGADKMVICDRYYLSSLVYQSNENFSMDDVMHLNKNARKPDIIFFMNVSNQVCYERMGIRNKPKELFEENLSQTREKYFAAISFLKEKRDETIIEINANGTIESVLSQMAESIYNYDPRWKDERLLQASSFRLQQPFTFSQSDSPLMEKILDDLQSHYNNNKTSEKNIDSIKTNIDSIFEKLTFSDLGSIFLDYLSSLNYIIGSQVPGTNLNVCSMDYQLPGGLKQQGVALLIDEPQRYDVILNSISSLEVMADFMFVFSPGPSDAVTTYFERDVIVTKAGKLSLFPNTRVITEGDLKEVVFNSFLKIT